MSIGPEHFSGKVVEEELFGKAEKETKHVEYLNFRTAMEVAKSIQPGDPKDPKSDFAYEVFIELERLLEIQKKDSLSFYTAIGSALDKFHSIDGWFEMDGETYAVKKGSRVTIDLTTNPHKGEYRADITFLVPRDGLDRSVNESEFLKYARMLAEQIAERFHPQYDTDYGANASFLTRS